MQIWIGTTQQQCSPAAGKLNPDELNSMFKLLKINRHLAKMSVYSVVLRGIKTKEDLTPERMRYVGLSGESPLTRSPYIPLTGVLVSCRSLSKH